MILLKLRRPFLLDTRFGPYTAPFTWYARLTYISYSQPSRYDSSYDMEAPTINETNTDIGSVYVSNVQYTSVASTVLMAAQEESYYWDVTNQVLYIHTNHNKRMVAADFDSLEIRGYSTDHVVYDTNDIEFLPFLSSQTSITQKADRLVYDKMAFVNNSAQLDNKTGEFDDTVDTPTPGADVNILYLSTADFNAGSRVFTPLYTGYVAQDNISLTKYGVKIQDKRAQYNINIPATEFDSTTYPNIDTDVEGKTIPEGYGDIIGAPAYCTDGTGTGNVDYKYCTDGTSITTVYVKTDDAWNTVTPVSTDPTNGELVLSAADARDDNDNPKEVKVDARFRDIDDPGDMMVDMIERYLGVYYNNTTFNTTQWESEDDYLADVYLYMGEQKKFFEYIEILQKSSDYGFMFFIDGSGRFSIKVDDINRAVSSTYQAICNISDETPSKRDFTQYATTVKTIYSVDQESGIGSSVLVDTYKDDTFDTYRYTQELTYTSGLKTSAAATDKGDLIALDYSVARNEITFELDEIVAEEIYNVISIDTAVYSKGVKIRDYLGTRTIKISGVKWDFSQERTVITGFDITDI